MRLAKISRLIGFCLLACMFTFGGASQILAENNYALTGPYLGLNFCYDSIGGEFDGETLLRLDGQRWLVPKVKSNYGFGVLFGWRFEKSKVAMGYYHSTHDYTFVDALGESTSLHLISLDARVYFSKEKTIQPFIEAEFAYTWMIVNDAAFTTEEPIRFGEASYRGLAYSVGGGIAYYLSPQISIDAGIFFRLYMYGSVKGLWGGVYEIEDGGLFSFSPIIKVGITYTFKTR